MDNRAELVATESGRGKRGRPSSATSARIRREIREEKNKNPEITATAIARKIKVNESTVSTVLRQDAEFKAEIDEFRGKRAELQDAKGKEILEAMTAQKIGNASIKDLTIAYGTLYDKSRLERGESTSNLAGIVKVLRVADQPGDHNP